MAYGRQCATRRTWKCILLRMLDAEAVAHVVEEGASIVGKTTLSSFLSREEATESIDYQIA